MSDAPDPADDEPVPRLPRGRGMKLDRAMMFRIGGTLILLIMIVVAARPCADATSKFVTGFGDEGSAVDNSKTMPKPGNVDQLEPEYEQIGSNMSEAEIKAAIERAKAKGRPATGSASGSGAGSGSAGAGVGSAGAGVGSAGAGSSDRAGSDAP